MAVQVYMQYSVANQGKDTAPDIARLSTLRWRDMLCTITGSGLIKTALNVVVDKKKHAQSSDLSAVLASLGGCCGLAGSALACSREIAEAVSSYKPENLYRPMHCRACVLCCCCTICSTLLLGDRDTAA